MALNKVILIGNVGHEPEVRYLEANDPQDKKKVASLRLATTERYKDRNGELKEATEWHSVVCWGKTADLVEKYVKKGMLIYVEGSLRTRDYMGRDNVKKTVTEVRADSLQLLSKKEASQEQPGITQGSPQVAPQSAPALAAGQDDDDLPF